MAGSLNVVKTELRTYFARHLDDSFTVEEVQQWTVTQFIRSPLLCAILGIIRICARCPAGCYYTRVYAAYYAAQFLINQCTQKS